MKAGCAGHPRSIGPGRLTALVLIGALAGCADVGMPDYRRPDSAAKASWSRQQAAQVSAVETISPDWWRQFRDPYLDQLVRIASAGNIDVRILAARIRVADAAIGESRAGALPSANLGAAASVDKSTGQRTTKQFSAGAALNWEADVWGKVEKGVQAQKAGYQASEADWRAGYLTMVSDVSTTYFQIMQLDEQIDQQQKTLEKNRQILAILEAMVGSGLLPNTRVLQQRAEINRLSNDLLEQRRARDTAENALGTLLGIGAGEFKVAPGRLQERVQLPVVPAGLPSQLLKRRPDIVAAEYRVLEAYDLLGQAKLAQLPSISLTGRGGTSSFALSDLLRAFTFNLLPSINIPLLDPGVKAHVKTTDAEVRVAEEQYRKTVITAFEEVENALVNLDAHRKQRIELSQQIAHLGSVAGQVDVQLKEGLVSQLDVFESQRSLLAAQLGLLANHQQILSDTVTLYKALGGGWPDRVVSQASQ